MQDQPTTSFRLSPQQARLWLTQDDAAVSVAQGALALHGALDAELLRAALERVLERHEILRTTYQTPAGMRMPLQAVEDDEALEWSVSELPGADADELLARERAREVNIERGPALRAHLVRVGETEHLLALTLPALSGDAGTFAAIATELAALYAGKGDALDDEPLQYADYAEWQHELAEAADADATAARSEWAAQRLEEVAPLELPPTAERDASGTVRARVELDGEAAAALGAGSASAFVLAAWEALLARVTGSEELAIDVIVDGRDDDELRSALGLLAKPVRVRAEIDAASPFAAAAQAAETALESIRHWQDSVPSPGAGAAPAAAFEWRADGGARKLDGLTVSVAARWSPGSSALVKLTAIAADGAISLEVSGDAGALDQETARRLAGSLRVLLTDALARPDAALGSLEVLTGEDHHFIARVNDTAAETPPVIGVHELFERRAVATPDHAAVVAAGSTVTYRELNVRANRLAHALRSRGAGPNKAVGILLDRSIESVVALLAALKAGAAALPLSTEHPAGRIEHQLRESDAVAVVTLEGLTERLPAWDGSLVRLDADADALAGEPEVDPDPVTTLADLAYIVYTSGSTGLPKGVGVTHGGILNYTWDMRTRLGLDGAEARHFALVSPIVTDLGNTAVYPALATGGCLHVIDESTAMDGALYGAYAEANPIDILKITPSHLAALLATGEQRLVLPRRQLVIGGEGASWELVEQVLDADCPVLNHYGPTETTVGSLTFPVARETASARRTAAVPIGRPISNTKILILDAAGMPAPIGAAGELCIGGAGVAWGYVGRPDETAERFVPHPFAEGERIYRTGDLARLLPSGDVEFLGRIDRQVKIRGYRVEPAEVEAALLRHPDVGQAAVVVREDKPGDQRLAAYVVAAGDTAPAADELGSLVSDYVPDYMVPSAFASLDGLPLTPNGKLDISALPVPDARTNGEHPHLAPRDELEEQVAAIWSEVLGVERIGVDDDFFELGGHSLLATQVIARVRNGLGVQLPLHMLFTSPTVAGLAAAVRESQDAAAPDEQELAAMLEELEGMSDEDAERLLSMESPGDE